MKILLSPRDAAKRLDLSTSRIQQLDREGRVKALGDSAGRRLYDPDTVDRFAADRKQAKRGSDVLAGVA